jgi:peptide/nickel transport system substrate-binding protein
MFSDFDDLNEFTSTDANATEVMEYMLYMPLLRWGKDLRLEGRLATSWEVSADGLEITMQLRDDVRWHDGAPTTAHDVVFSFDRFRDPRLGYPDVGGTRRIERVEALGDHVVRFRFDSVYADQLAHLRRVIMPKHLLEDVPSDRMESAPFNRSPVGNGPFRFVRWRQNEEIVFEANPDFADGRPPVDRIVFRVIPDQTALETAFLAGEIDVVERLRVERVGKLRRDPRCRVHTYPARGYQFVGWNLRNPLFADADVRLALTRAIDRERIVSALLSGEGRVTAHPVMSASPYHAADVAPHPYDPDAARRALAAAGFEDRDGDGVRERGDLAFEFELVTNLGNRLREDTLVMIQDDLAKVGVRAIPRVREWSVFLDDVQGKRFDAFHMAWRTDFILSPYDTFHSGAIEGKYNSGSYANPRVDELIDRGLAARTAAEAAPIWHEFQEILHRDQPYTVLFELDYSLGASPRLRGVEADIRGWLLSVERWAVAGRGAA